MECATRSSGRGAKHGSALLRIASAVEQKQGSAGTVQEAFGLNPAIASSQEEYAAFFDYQSSREAFGLADFQKTGARDKGGEISQKEVRSGHSRSRGPPSTRAGREICSVKMPFSIISTLF